ncbi:MAG TPA: hypothetical protein PLA45_02400 [Candidatus Dojkabacteria bacterium]|nr:hypothetical protein [Candidatus Dojkabacteria bacterium]
MKDIVLENGKVIKKTKTQRINDLAWDLVDTLTGNKEIEDLEEALSITLTVAKNIQHYHLKDKHRIRQEQLDKDIELINGIIRISDFSAPQPWFDGLRSARETIKEQYNAIK